MSAKPSVTTNAPHQQPQHKPLLFNIPQRLMIALHCLLTYFNTDYRAHYFSSMTLYIGANFASNLFCARKGTLCFSIAT